jgi:hypothetical protein
VPACCKNSTADFGLLADFVGSAAQGLRLKAQAMGATLALE